MNLRASTYALALRETFRIARDATDEETVVGVELTHDGITAYGEGAPVDYWGETPEGMCEAIERRRRRARSATTCSPARRSPSRLRRLGRPAGREDGARRRASTTGWASAPASRLRGCWARRG